MKRILFVDDEADILDGLRRVLSPLRDQWEVACATSGTDALALLDKGRFDVVISDMRMPGMDGAQLLAEVMKRTPQSVRIILSGQADEDIVLRAAGVTHIFLSKPCDAEILKATVARACQLREVMANAKLQGLVSRIQSLPSLPSAYSELIEELRSPNSSMRKVADIISRDVGMSSKILQLVNSAFFGLSRRMTSPKHASIMLGLRTVSSLALSVQVFSAFDSSKAAGFDAERLMAHSVATASLAKLMSKAEGLSEELCSYAFTAGLLHDAGKLVLATSLPVQYSVAIASAAKVSLPLWRVEQEAFGASHAEVGAYLLGLWGFGDAIVEALAFHHCPSLCPQSGFSVLTAVHVANALEKAGLDPDAKEPVPGIDMDYLGSLKLADRLPAWRQICHKPDLPKDDD